MTATPRAPGGIAGSAALTAASLVASMGLGALLAVLVLLLFGKSAETDAFFAAYGVFALLNSLAQSLRVTVVARIVEAPSPWRAFDRLLGAVLLMAVVTALPLVLFGEALAALLVGGLGERAEGTARTALALLWAAAGLQLVNGVGAAALGARERFARPALAYIAGSATALALLALTAGTLGIAAVSVSMALGSLLAVALMLGPLRRAGWRPRVGSLVPGRDSLRTVVQLVSGSLGYVVMQVTYVISLGFAARLGEGAVTLYSYAFFGALLLIGISSGPAGMVLAAPLARTWDRRPATLRPHLLAVLRMGLVLVVPLVALVGFVGDELLDVLLGGAVSAAEGDLVVAAFLALGGLVLAQIANPVPMVAAFAAGRYRAVALISLAAAAVHLAATWAALRTGRLEAVGLAASAGGVAFLVMLLGVVWGRAAGGIALLVLRETALVGALAAGCFGLAWVGAAITGGGLAAQAAGYGIGLLGFALLGRRVLPAHAELVGRLTGPLAARLRPS